MDEIKYDIPQLESLLKKERLVLDKYRSKERIWRRVLYFSLGALVLCALLAFLFRFFTDAYWLPAMWVAVMSLLLLFAAVSFEKIKWWEGRTEIQSSFIREKEVSLIDAKANAAGKRNALKH